MRALALGAWLAASLVPVLWFALRAANAGGVLLAPQVGRWMDELLAASIVTLAAWPAALAFARARFIGRRGAILALALGACSPALASSVHMRPWPGGDGVLAWLGAQAVLGLQLAAAVWVLTAAARRIPPHLHEAAHMDGLGPLRRLAFVAWPALARPTAHAWLLSFALGAACVADATPTANAALGDAVAVLPVALLAGWILSRR